jgi:FkbM family methyltransferase
MSLFRILKQKLKRLYYSLHGLYPDIAIPITTVNPGDQAWYFATNSLQAGDIVYSLGLATNIEFDLNIISACNVEVHGFDPTPESVNWITRQKLPRQFNHHPIAVAGHDGELTFSLPDQHGECAKALRGNQTSTSTLVVPCRKLSSLAAQLNHQRIALLKMDIEGSEYAVIEELLSSSIQVDQILVEFHHRFMEYKLLDTLNAVKNLRANGYKLFHVSPWCEEFAFMRT